jgi:hypothetical protein
VMIPPTSRGPGALQGIVPYVRAARKPLSAKAPPGLWAPAPPFSGEHGAIVAFCAQVATVSGLLTVSSFRRRRLCGRKFR